MDVDDLVAAVEAHREHLAPIVTELASSPIPCLRTIAQRLDDNGRRLESLCAGLGASSLRHDEAAG